MPRCPRRVHCSSGGFLLIVTRTSRTHPHVILTLPMSPQIHFNKHVYTRWLPVLKWICTHVDDNFLHSVHLPRTHCPTDTITDNRRTPITITIWVSCDNLTFPAFSLGEHLDGVWYQPVWIISTQRPSYRRYKRRLIPENVIVLIIAVRSSNVLTRYDISP